MVYRHLPDFARRIRTPLDWGGLLLFGSGIGLLSYVLEVFGEHTLSLRERSWACWHFRRAAYRYGFRAPKRDSRCFL